jgi:hypothetical protein
LTLAEQQCFGGRTERESGVAVLSVPRVAVFVGLRARPPAIANTRMSVANRPTSITIAVAAL